MMSSPTVLAADVSREFDGTMVIEGLDLSVDEGTIQGLIGPSGSGKTTTVRMLTGYLPVSSGTVEVFGRAPGSLDTAARQRIGYMPQLGVLYPELTIRDNLMFVSSLYGVRRQRERITAVLEMLDMAGTESLRLDAASGGMQRRVALAGALMHDPDLLFLDEPTSGLDPILRQEVWEHFTSLRNAGTTIVVTTQIVSEATMCDTVGLIADGSVLASGSPDDLRRKADGGDVVMIRTETYLTPEAIVALRDHPVVRQASRLTGHDLRLVVADADTAMPQIDAVLADEGLDLQISERQVLPFDDVFVALLDREAADA